MDKKLLMKVVMLAMSLGVVIYGIKILKSPEFTKTSSDSNSTLSLLLGNDARPLNWCFDKTEKIEILNDNGSIQKTVESPQDISSLCEIMIGGVATDKLAQAVFIRRLVAHSSKKEEKVLEQTEGSGIFRVQGLPFSSPMLEKVLQRLIGASSP